MDLQAATAPLNQRDLDTVQQDIDHAFSRRVTLPPRSVIDAGTDAMVQHLRTFISHLNGPDARTSRNVDVPNLMRAAERNLDVPVRPTPQSTRRDAYVYWHTVATLTTAFRDLYLAHNGQEPRHDAHRPDPDAPHRTPGRGPGASVEKAKGWRCALCHPSHCRPHPRHLHRRDGTPHRRGIGLLRTRRAPTPHVGDKDNLA
ncbi:hypothetical protein N7925_35805 [Streptomyces sp. CA-278952]|uniref:hypothetical protein n=1 Tax=unclassified Streptomyces TaxID=2593676 RepID=UPI00236884FB|nr:hypothetical protein [Streptomyces sp. CA-278952]WDG33314.1 hypothetical protein N7925_35805 [Streptomyces sp. CA-278952]